MTQINYRPLVLAALTDTPRSVGSIATEITDRLQREGRQVFVEHQAVRDNLRRLEAMGMARRVGMRNGKADAVRWIRGAAA